MPSRLNAWLDEECWSMTTALARQTEPIVFADEIEQRVAEYREALRRSWRGQCLAFADANDAFWAEMRKGAEEWKRAIERLTGGK